MSPFFFGGYVLTELEATNVILSAIGESPVSTLDSQHPDVLSSRLLLKMARYEILEAGKWFNSESAVVLTPNTAGEIVLPSSTLLVDPIDPVYDYVQRGSRLYNKTAHTFVFASSVSVDLVFDLPFNDLPFVAQNLCTYNAAHAMQNNFVGDQNKLANLSARLKAAQTAFNRAEINAGDYNIKNSSAVQKMLSGMRGMR